MLGPYSEKDDMKTEHNEINGYQEILERKESDLVNILRKRDGIVLRRARTKWMRFSMRRSEIWRFET
jgi:succinate dehydrogenase flavin-adding protein (antitoxin of CptAB toxin-antitoxin module)